jgi:hypothetical protein
MNVTAEEEYRKQKTESGDRRQESEFGSRSGDHDASPQGVVGVYATLRPHARRHSATPDSCFLYSLSPQSRSRLQPLLFPVRLGHHRGSIAIVLDPLDENGNSGADQNKEADDTAFPIGRYTEKDKRVIDHRDQEDTDQCAENGSATASNPGATQDHSGEHIELGSDQIKRIRDPRLRAMNDAGDSGN